MSWDEFAQKLDKTTSGSAVISDNGAICGKHKEFSASPQEAIQIAALFKDMKQCRQKGVPYDGQKYFVTEFNDKSIVARRDNFFIFLQKSQTIIVAGVCDLKTAKEAKANIEQVIKELAEMGEGY